MLLTSTKASLTSTSTIDLIDAAMQLMRLSMLSSIVVVELKLKV